MYAYPGALHMHTLHSDGSGTVAELALAARDAGLRWIIITDHDTLAGRPDAGWVSDVLVIVGHEITPERNHFLALNTSRTIDQALPTQQYIDAVYTDGGFGIIAHPDERVVNRFKQIYRWDDWQIDGPSDRVGRPVGIELWNVMSDWAEHLTDLNTLVLVARPELGLSGPSAATLAWWDDLNMRGRRTFGVGGVDAHAIKRRAPWGEITVLPYRWIFGTVTNYLLMDQPLSRDAAAATHEIYAALTAGRAYFVNRLAGEADLTFVARRGDAEWPCGATVDLRAGAVTFVASVGDGSGSDVVQLIGDGRVVASGRGLLRHSVVASGVYRLEVYRRNRPWIYTNPLFLEEML